MFLDRTLFLEKVSLQASHLRFPDTVVRHWSLNSFTLSHADTFGLTDPRTGVCILFNNNFKFDILKSFQTPLDVILYAILKLTKNFFTLANIYAPNKDDPSFFNETSSDHLHDFACEEIILGGDFNLVLDVKKDKKGGLPRTYQNALKIINQNCEKLN